MVCIIMKGLRATPKTSRNEKVRSPAAKSYPMGPSAHRPSSLPVQDVSSILQYVLYVRYEQYVPYVQILQKSM